MASFLQFFSIAATIATIFGQTINVTTSAQDYYLLSQRELLHEIQIVENEVNAVDARYADQLNIIDFQQQQLLTEIQQYNSQLVTYDNAKLKMKVCSDKAAITASGLTTYPKANVASAKNQVLVILPRSVASCDDANSKNQTSLELCFINTVNLVTSNVNAELNTARERMIMSMYEATTASQTAVKCSFLVEKDALQTIGQTNKNINNCILSINRQTTKVASSASGGINVEN